jgi:hypothetical protein
MHKGRGADAPYLPSQGCNPFISTTHTFCTSSLSEAAPEPKRRIASSELTLESLSQSPRFEDGTLTVCCRERELWFHTNNIFLVHASICRYLGQTITLTLRVFFTSSVAAPKNLSERRLQYKFAWTALSTPSTYASTASSVGLSQCGRLPHRPSKRSKRASSSFPRWSNASWALIPPLRQAVIRLCLTSSA